MVLHDQIIVNHQQNLAIFEKYLNISVIIMYISADFYRCQNHNKTTGKPADPPGNWQKKLLKVSKKNCEKMTSNGNNSSVDAEAVNGKIDLGVRKLRASYVENATTVYAYLESEFDILKEYTDKMNKAYQNAGKIEDKMNENDIYLVFSDKDKCTARAR